MNINEVGGNVSDVSCREEQMTGRLTSRHNIHIAGKNQKQLEFLRDE